MQPGSPQQHAISISSASSGEGDDIQLHLWAFQQQQQEAQQPQQQQHAQQQRQQQPQQQAQQHAQQQQQHAQQQQQAQQHAQQQQAQQQQQQQQQQQAQQHAQQQQQQQQQQQPPTQIKQEHEQQGGPLQQAALVGQEACTHQMREPPRGEQLEPAWEQEQEQPASGGGGLPASGPPVTEAPSTLVLAPVHVNHLNIPIRLARSQWPGRSEAFVRLHLTVDGQPAELANPQQLARVAVYKGHAVMSRGGKTGLSAYFGFRVETISCSDGQTVTLHLRSPDPAAAAAAAAAAADAAADTACSAGAAEASSSPPAPGAAAQHTGSKRSSAASELRGPTAKRSRGRREGVALVPLWPHAAVEESPSRVTVCEASLHDGLSISAALVRSQFGGQQLPLELPLTVVVDGREADLSQHAGAHADGRPRVRLAQRRPGEYAVRGCGNAGLRSFLGCRLQSIACDGSQLVLHLTAAAAHDAGADEPAAALAGADAGAGAAGAEAAGAEAASAGTAAAADAGPSAWQPAAGFELPDAASVFDAEAALLDLLDSLQPALEPGQHTLLLQRLQAATGPLLELGADAPALQRLLRDYAYLQRWVRKRDAARVLHTLDDLLAAAGA